MLISRIEGHSRVTAAVLSFVMTLIKEKIHRWLLGSTVMRENLHHKKSAPCCLVSQNCLWLADNLLDIPRLASPVPGYPDLRILNSSRRCL
ncbi:hypothetical protein MRX96_043479 [Rhipicephalus microplus]